ncbi:hypothetical protein QBC40DRAFT_280033 [Triangularia verruculosa]|uniref:GPI anchored serine-rich protein n=1 Tax=Triangularia verruculosa TaxID=2587418 RepID=A0AAN7ATE8_9PEZI|nr:hypothetical protein QBC40DRAFT_280033 [Triangularia verruculosa]
MRFAVAAVALAGAAIASEVAEEAQSTVYSTEYYTVTSCLAEVTDCPASATVVTSSVFPITTSTIYATSTYTVTDCPETVTDCPADSTQVVTEVIPISTTVCPVTEVEPTPSATSSHYFSNTTVVEQPPYPTSVHGEPTKPAPVPTFVTVAPECPGTSIKTISTSITTVIPTVIYETVEVPCPTGGPGVPGGPGAPAPSGAVPSGGLPSGTNPPPPVFTAGASTVGGSIALAAVAGFLALLA